MTPAHHGRSHPEAGDTPPPIAINIQQLTPLEIVLVRRYVHDMPLEGFPAFDQLALEFEQQLAALPQVNLEFAREVYQAFAMSPYPIDRLHIGLILGPLTLADHDAGFVLWHQLVRDEHPRVRRDVYEPIHRHLTADDDTAAGLAEEGLTLADGRQLRDAFIGAQYLGGSYVVDQTEITEPLQEATRSFETIVRV